MADIRDRISKFAGQVVGTLSQPEFPPGQELYGSLVPRATTALDVSNKSNATTSSSAPMGLFITIDRGLDPGQWADLGGYINALAFLARGDGLDTCPQVPWIRLYKVVGAFLQLPPEQVLFCGMAIGYGDHSHPVNSFRSSRAELHEFCKFYGFD